MLCINCPHTFRTVATLDGVRRDGSCLISQPLDAEYSVRRMSLGRNEGKKNNIRGAVEFFQQDHNRLPSTYHSLIFVDQIPLLEISGTPTVAHYIILTSTRFPFLKHSSDQRIWQTNVARPITS